MSAKDEVEKLRGVMRQSVEAFRRGVTVAELTAATDRIYPDRVQWDNRRKAKANP